MFSSKQQIADSLGITITERPNLKSIQLTYGDRTLSPESYADWRLACQCLALRKPAHQPTDYFELWVDWSRQSEKAKELDLVQMATIWHTYLPIQREAVAELIPGNRITDTPSDKPNPREVVQLKIKRLTERAIMPTFGTDGAACFDLYAIVDTTDGVMANFQKSPNSITVETGWAFEVPEGWVMKVYSRSGQGFKDNIRLANCVGIIDSDYRGPLRVKLTRDDGEMLFVRHGDRVAQAMLERVTLTQFVEVDELSGTQRGEAGYGSTGR